MFSGEYVSVTLPAESPGVLGGPDSVLALRCHRPDRIQDLLHRLFDHLSQHPLANSQQLQIKPVEELEGFEKISALLLAVLGAQPVIGFQEGWMFVGSNRQVVQQVLDARAGRSVTIDQTEAFTRFGMEVTGPVHGIAYTDVAEQIRSIAQFLNQVGPVAQAVVGLMGIQADAEQMKVVQELLGLLPSIGKIVSRFDFLQAKLIVTQSGEEPGSYLKRTTVLVRPPVDRLTVDLSGERMRGDPCPIDSKTTRAVPHDLSWIPTANRERSRSPSPFRGDCPNFRGETAL